MRSALSSRRRAPLQIVALATAACLGLAGCSSDDADPSSDTSPSTSSSDVPSPTASPTSDVSVPDGVELTAQGSDLEFGETATVEFSPDQKRTSLLEMTVTRARKGTLEDFKGFILDDYKRNAHYFYVDVTVKNVGEKNVGDAPVPLWGVNEENTLLRPVVIETSFEPCASAPLPKKFKPGTRLKTCLVYLAPDKGSLESLSFRPDQAFDPIEWTGKIERPKSDKQKSKKKSGNG